MTEYLDEMTMTPHRLILSGEGLRQMPISQFKTLARNLGRMGIQIEGIDFATRPSGAQAEITEAIDALYKKDFFRIARERDMSRVNAGRTWNALTTPWKMYSQAFFRQASGETLYSWEQQALQKPQWQIDLCIAEDELSYPNLRAAYEADLLYSIKGMGEKYVEFVGVVLEDTE